jgi:hypothetical protein
VVEKRKYMELRKIKLSQELREAREDLLNINFATDTTNRMRRNASRPYTLIDGWLFKWMPTFKKLPAMSGMYIQLDIDRQLNGYEQETDPEIFNELRPAIVAFIDHGLRTLDREHVVKPLLQEYIKRVQDTKLAELLKEFDAAKDTSPNLTAMGFRTILSLIIQEKAKKVSPTSRTATRTDLAPQSVIDSARNEQILSKDEQRLLDSFVSTHKDIYDFVTHRPSILIDKNEVDIMVDLLNKLLPSIIN